MAHGEADATAHVAQWKKDKVAELAKILTDQPVVGIASIAGIPGPQMLEMRASLRDHVKIVGVKNNLIQLALDEAAKKNQTIAGLKEKVDGQIAIIATDLNPFTLYKRLGSGATMAPAKGGAPAPCDIVVEKGDTPFGPGPIVGEFQKVGIPAKIEGGKVVVTKTVTAVKEGEIISAELANMLAKLEIKPVELKINLKAAVELDTLFTPDVLDIDEDQILGDLMRAHLAAYNVALDAAWATPRTIPELIGRAYRAGRSVALEADWITGATIEALATKAHKLAIATAIEAGVDMGDQQDNVAEGYARILASIGKTEAELSDDVKERLSKHLGILSGAAAAPAAAVAASEAPAEEEEEEEVSEEDAAAGLGALFG